MAYGCVKSDIYKECIGCGECTKKICTNAECSYKQKEACPASEGCPGYEEET